MLIVADHLGELFIQAGYDCKVTTQNIWESYALPPSVDLIVQLLPAFSQAEASCPVINIKPLLVDLNHAPTIQKVLKALDELSIAPQPQATGTVETNYRLRRL